MSDAGKFGFAAACSDEPTSVLVPHHAFTLALVGNPNAGKTTLFNALTGLHAKTANFPGTTVERRVGRALLGDRQIIMVDLPGLYSLESSSPDEKIASDALHGRLDNHPAPNAALVVVDATNLERNLFLVSQVLELDCPVVVALNMMDTARRDGIRIDVAKLRTELGCPVVPISARTGMGLGELKGEIERLATGKAANAAAHAKPACTQGCSGCPYQARYEWTEQISTKVMDAVAARRSARTEKIDDLFTHPVAGVVVFQIVMLLLFALIFWAAQIPMDLISRLFSTVGAWVTTHTPAGDVQSLLVNGVVGGVGGVLVFLPQICILFFALSLLEDTGYLSRAALVMDKIMRRLGLPGKAFVPLLSAHACAIPAIMSTRVIENPRDRLVTILVTPLLTCSARIPVYAMVTALLFPHSPLKAALVFTAAYATGALAAVLAAVVFNRTILPGGSRPLLIELPPYRLPGLRTALLHTFDRAKIFVKQAGTIILMVSLALWALSHYPKSAPPPAAVALTAQAAQLEKSGDSQKADGTPRGRRPAVGAVFAAKFRRRQDGPFAGAGAETAWLRLADRHRHHQLVRRARGHRFHAGHCLWRRPGRRRTSQCVALRFAAPGHAIRRHADVHHGHLRQPAGVLHTCRAMPFHHGGRASRNGRLEMAAVPNRLHDRAGLPLCVHRVSNRQPLRALKFTIYDL